MSDARRLEVEGLGNARDLGVLPREGGGTTPTGVFVRSENPDLVTDAGWSVLQDHGVRTVVDLRREDELDGRSFERPDWLAVHRVDALDARFTREHWDDGLAGTALHYAEFLTEAPRPTVDVLSALASAGPGAVLFHCAGGRDRTGLIAAVLLRAAGVETEAIVDDYLETVRNAPAYWSIQGRPDVEPRVAAMMAARGTTTEGAFRDFLDHLDIEPLLAAMTPEHAAAIRTWRGTLP